MKQFITPSYTFSPGLSGVGYIDLYGIENFEIKRLVSVINQTQGIVIYSTASIANKYTSTDGWKVYLNYDTSTHNASDEIQVIYETVDTFSSLSLQEAILQSLKLIRDAVMYPANYDRSLNSGRVNMTAGVLSSGTLTTCSTVTAVTTLGNQTSIGGLPAEMQVNSMNRDAWANCCRARMT